jgi:hypothetical protein
VRANFRVVNVYQHLADAEVFIFKHVFGSIDRGRGHPRCIERFRHFGASLVSQLNGKSQAANPNLC